MVQTSDPSALTSGQQTVLQLNLNRCTKILLWFGGGPKNEKDLRYLRNLIVNRFDWKHALKYVDDANYKFINKAHGLLAFNGLTITALRLGDGATQIHPLLLDFGVGFAIASAMLLLSKHFLVNFGRLEDYMDDEHEFEFYLLQIVKKAKWIWISGLLSFLSLVPLVAIIVINAYSWGH